MRKEATQYALGERTGDVIQVIKDGKPDGFGTLGVVSCLEKIFSDEGSNKQDWYIAEGNEIFKVNREEWKISQEQEEQIK